MVMEITKGKSSRVWCTIGCVKKHHENHKHKSFYLTLSLLLDFTCNLRHELELDLWESEQFSKENLQAKKEKKIACVKPYERM
jgi:hypothetical protein